MTTVPDVVGKSGSFAEQMLRAANLNVQFEGDSGGKVTAQSVEPDASAAYGTIVTLTMESGQPAEETPSENTEPESQPESQPESDAASQPQEDPAAGEGTA